MRKFEKVERLKETDIKLPERSTKNSAGYDFYAIDRIEIPPFRNSGACALIPTGVKAKMEDDEFLMLVNRSSNPLRKGLIIPQGMGIIDADYYENDSNDGEMFFCFINVEENPVVIEKGDKIGQGIFMKYGTIENDNASGKRTGGIGSTGE